MKSKQIWLGLAISSGLLFYQFLNYNLLQDDAFISFRYVQNYLNGNGLSFNISERVEGYTNFLWTVILVVTSKLGLPLVQTARVLGLVFSVGTLILIAAIVHQISSVKDWLQLMAAPLLMAATGALGYWGGSGLETGLFTFLAAGAIFFYLSNPLLSLFFTSLAALTRPEGAWLALLIGVVGITLKNKSAKSTLIFWATLTVLLLPYLAFKWFYYGSLLPNPFYAKAGWEPEYLQNGLEYLGLFLKQYGLYGLGLLLPILMWKQLAELSRFVFLVFLGYAFYVVWVGGDVLPAHRFFVPVLGLFYVPLADSISKLVQKLKFQRATYSALLLFLAFVFYWLPFRSLQVSAFLDRQLVLKMTTNAHLFAPDTTIKSFAVTALGAISYHLMDRRFIDMVGLTEPNVAKNPEHIEGLLSTVNERRYNAGYVLSQKPDVILFNTGAKPTSLPERALCLYPDFRRNYRLEFLCGEEHFEMYYRRFQDLPAPNRPDRPASFANLVNEGINQLNSKDYQRGVALLQQALSTGPQDCPALLIILGYLFYGAGVPDSSEFYLKKGLELDGGGSVGRYYYRNFLYLQGRHAEAAKQDSLLLKMVPAAAQFLTRIPTDLSRRLHQ